MLSVVELEVFLVQVLAKVQMEVPRNQVAGNLAGLGAGFQVADDWAALASVMAVELRVELEACNGQVHVGVA